MFLIDYSSLLIAVAFTGGTLAVTLFTTWLTTRTESFLLTWAVGAVLVVAGAASFSAYSLQYNDPRLAAASFIVLAVGLVTFYGAARQFREPGSPWRAVLLLGAFSGIAITVPFAIGYSGLGAGIANLVMAALLFMSAREYWLCRLELPTALLTLSMLHAAVAITFVLCAILIFIETPLVLTHAPQNWAEDLNAFVSLIAISGIGATALAVNQSRMASRHKTESLTDALTGLVNRRALFTSYENGRVPSETSLIIFDLDRFKAVNDNYGHAVGDLVLQEFTDVLKSGLRPTDTAARMGGEEFVLVLPGCNLQCARDVGERIRVRFSEKIVETEKGVLRCTVSAGVASSAGKESDDINTILRQADEALYMAKRSGGRNCTVVYNGGYDGTPESQSTSC